MAQAEVCLLSQLVNKIIMLLTIVPVIAIFTKLDDFETSFWNDLGDDKFKDNAFDIAKEKAKKMFDTNYLPQIQNSRYPPKKHVCLRGIIQVYKL